MIDYTWVRVTRKIVAKATQAEAAAWSVAVAVQDEVRRLDAAYQLVGLALAEALANAEAAISAEKAGKARCRKIVRLTANSKAEAERLRALEWASFVAWHTVRGNRAYTLQEAHRNAVIALREAKDRAFWAEVDAFRCHCGE